MCSFSTSVCTVRRSVKGGCTETSTPGHVVGLQPQPEVAHRVQRLNVIVVHLPVPADQRAAVHVSSLRGRVRGVARGRRCPAGGPRAQ